MLVPERPQPMRKTGVVRPDGLFQRCQTLRRTSSCVDENPRSVRRIRPIPRTLAMVKGSPFVAEAKVGDKTDPRSGPDRLDPADPGSVRGDRR